MGVTIAICEMYESLSCEELASISSPVLLDFIRTMCASWRVQAKEIEQLRAENTEQGDRIEQLRETVRVRGQAVRRLDAKLAQVMTGLHPGRKEE